MLEEKIAELIAALNENTAVHKGIAAKLGAAAGAAGKPAGAAAGAKPAGTAAKPAAKTTAKPKAPTIEDIRARFGGYLSTKDKDIRAIRLDQVAAINAHFGVAKASDLDPTLFAEALGYLKTYEDGGEPEFAQADEGVEGEDGGDEEEGESLV